MSLRQGHRSLAAAIATAAALAGLAGPADARLKAGVHSAEESRSDSEWQRMAQGDVRVVRRAFEYTSNVEEFDPLVRGASDADLKLLPVVMGTPEGPSDPPRTDKELDAFSSFTAELVERYGRDGTFWCQSEPDIGAGCARSYRPIPDWQVLNEPSLNHFWAGDPNPREYARALEVANGAIESEDPEADTVLAGMPYDTTKGMSLDRFIRKLYEVGGVEDDFDAAAVHPYGRDEEDVEFIVKALRAKMDTAGDGGTDIWVTEFGWASDGYGKGFLVGDREDQARLLTRTYELLNDRRRRYDLDTAVWFDFRDDAPPSGDNRAFNYTGLFEHNGFAKPSWFAFTDYTGGDPGSGDVDVPPVSAKSSGSTVLDAPAGDLRPPPDR